MSRAARRARIQRSEAARRNTIRLLAAISHNPLRLRGRLSGPATLRAVGLRRAPAMQRTKRKPDGPRAETMKQLLVLHTIDRSPRQPFFLPELSTPRHVGPSERIQRSRSRGRRLRKTALMDLFGRLLLYLEHRILAYARGNRTRNADPRPISLSASRRAWCRSAIHCAIESPSPAPPASRLRDSSTR